MMGTRILAIITMIAAAAVAHISLAQEAERDPFFSAGPRATGKDAVQQGGGWGRDPFTRPFEGKTAVPQIRAARPRGKSLTGILYGDTVRFAIIDGETYKEGSMVGDQTLAEIRNRSVVLISNAGGAEEIFLENFSIRK